VENITMTEKTIQDNILKGKPVVIFFHMNGCGYCIQAMPEWKKIPSISGISMFDIEQSNASGLIAKYNVVGFPTLLFIHGNKVETYEGERTKESMEQWIRSRLTASSKGGRRKTRRVRRRRRGGSRRQRRRVRR